MASDKGEQGKRVVLVILGVICAWLVYRNLVVPAQKSVSASVAGTPPQRQSAVSRLQDEALRVSPPQNSGNQPTSLRSSPGRRDQAKEQKDQQDLAALDPTLRLDLLQKVRELNYEGNARNIFQFYTPPPPSIPKPVSNPIVAPPASPNQPSQPPAAPPANIPLKFYGVASRPGSSEKKAFLSDGDEIFVGQVGDTVDKNYKIGRIGVYSIDLEDIRTKQHHQLPLLEE